MSSNLSACCFRSIQHYKDNNLQLAINLNETRKENRTLNEVLTRKCSEYQQICVENSYLRAELAVKDKQLAMWHSAVADVVKNNTRGLTQLMTLLAPQSVATANNHNNDAPTTSTIPQSPPPPANPQAQNVQLSNRASGISVTVRRQSLTKDLRRSMPKLVEENHTQRSPSQKRRASDESEASDTSSVASMSPAPRRTLRRSSSYSSPSSPISSASSSSSAESPASPSSPHVARRALRRCFSTVTPETKSLPTLNDNTKKTSKKGKLPAEKENDASSIASNDEESKKGRPRRKVAPVHLKEDKLNVKLRRRQ